nr:unnamed protein product [Callosobruchus chinensis]
MLLPCRHIFKKREEQQINMFEEQLCNQRWTRKRYYSNQRIFLSDIINAQDNLTSPITESHTLIKQTTKLNQHQKFNKAWLYLKSLAGLMSEAGDARYHARFRQLIQLKTAWENDKDVVVMELQTKTFQLENEEVCNSIEISIENEGLDNVDLGNKIQNINTVENYLGNEKSLGNQDNVVLQKEIQIVNVLEDEQNFTSENSEMESRQILISQEVSQTNEKIPIIFNSDDNLNITPHSQLQSVLEDSKDQNCLGDIKLPVAIKKRSRPKGRANTVIGLEEKRRKKRVNNTKKK